MATANFIGVYSSQTGSRRQNARKRYWFVWDDLRGGFIVQLLDPAYKPLDEPRTVKRDEFNERFTPEPSIYVSPLSRLEIPDFEDASSGSGYGAPDKGAPSAQGWGAGAFEGRDGGTGGVGGVARADGREGREGRENYESRDGASSSTQRGQSGQSGQSDHFDNSGKLGSLGKLIDAAEAEQAAEIDHELRSEFALALVRLQRGEKATAVTSFEKIVARKEGIIPAHKHMFTDFGVYLRKGQLPAVAFKFYQRALDLAPEDSNAYFNMARIMYDLGDIDGSEKHLQQALNLDEDFDEARRFLELVLKSRSKRSGSAAKKRGTLDASLFSLK